MAKRKADQQRPQPKKKMQKQTLATELISGLISGSAAPDARLSQPKRSARKNLTDHPAACVRAFGSLDRPDLITAKACTGWGASSSFGETSAYSYPAARLMFQSNLPALSLTIGFSYVTDRLGCLIEHRVFQHCKLGLDSL